VLLLPSLAGGGSASLSRPLNPTTAAADCLPLSRAPATQPFGLLAGLGEPSSSPFRLHLGRAFRNFRSRFAPLGHRQLHGFPRSSPTYHDGPGARQHFTHITPNRTGGRRPAPAPAAGSPHAPAQHQALATPTRRAHPQPQNLSRRLRFPPATPSTIDRRRFQRIQTDRPRQRSTASGRAVFTSAGDTTSRLTAPGAPCSRVSVGTTGHLCVCGLFDAGLGQTRCRGGVKIRPCRGWPMRCCRAPSMHRALAMAEACIQPWARGTWATDTHEVALALLQGPCSGTGNNAQQDDPTAQSSVAKCDQVSQPIKKPRLQAAAQGVHGLSRPRGVQNRPRVRDLSIGRQAPIPR
jgi:hypothetical protein